MTEKLELQPKPVEGIRRWYHRKTKGAIIALLGATGVTLVGAVMLWILAELPFLAHMQTFNGAITIPAFGGIWIASFMFIWLIPMREVSFRGQESMERMEDRMEVTMTEKLVPAIETWQRVGDRLEKSVLPRFEQAIARIEAAAEKVEKKVLPAIEVGRRIEANIEAELTTGLLQEVRSAAQSINLIVMSKDGVPSSPSVDRALAAITKNGPTQRGGNA